jgi:hypothetical protein
VGAVRPTDRRSGTHRKWIGMDRVSVNSEITFSSSLEKSVAASAEGEGTRSDVFRTGCPLVSIRERRAKEHFAFFVR